MSKATNALDILKKNLDFEDLLELIELISGYLEVESQNTMMISEDFSHENR